MAKKNRTMRPQQMYNRPTKGFQQNMSKNMVDLNPPAMPTRRSTIITNVVVIGVLVLAIILLNIFLPWWTTFIPVILAFVYLVVYGRYMNKKQLELVSYYQKMGLTKKYFMKQSERQAANASKNKKRRFFNSERNADQNVAYYAKMWDIAAGKPDVKLNLMDKIMGLKAGKGDGPVKAAK